MDRGQASIEMLGVALIGMMLFVPLFFIAMDFVNARSFEESISQARIAADSLADAADTMCLQPEGSRTEVSVTLPTFVDTEQSSIGNRTVKFVLRRETSEEIVTSTTKCEINGTVPSESGSHVFVVKRETDTVNITEKS